MKQLSSKLTYSNVISTICLFLLLGGGTAFAANQLAKNSVGTKQLKNNAVTTAKIKKAAVTGAKIKLSTLGTVPSATNASHASSADTATNATNATNAGNSATTSVVKGSHGTLSIGQSAVIFQYGPFAITAKCEPYNTTEIGMETIISSSTAGSAFSSWDDGSPSFGPTTPEEKREISSLSWANSNGPFSYEGPSDANVSASAANGQAFNAFIGEATEKNTNTCWYWLTANVIS
jgi:hypothetical protein